MYATETLPAWTGTEIAQEVGATTGLAVHVENDVNALAVGEAGFGAGRGLTDFVCITLGTGVGGGCDVGGRVCNRGQRGCLEMYTNAAALLGYAQDRYRSAEELIAAAHVGGAIALEAIRELSHRLAIGCGILVQLLDPQALIIAGGLVRNNPFLLSNLEAELPKLVTVWTEAAATRDCLRARLSCRGARRRGGCGGGVLLRNW